MRFLKHLWRDIGAVTSLEYAVIAGAIIVTAIYLFGTFADAVRLQLQAIGTHIQ